MSKLIVTVAADVLDEQTHYTLDELCSACGITVDIILDMVAEGVVEPEGPTPEAWRFAGTALVRIQAALRLQRDLRVNLPGAALALDLLEELEALRRRHLALGRSDLSR